MNSVTHNIYRDLPYMVELQWRPVVKFPIFKRLIRRHQSQTGSSIENHSINLAPKNFSYSFFYLALQQLENIPLQVLSVNAQDVPSDFFLSLLKKSPELRKLEVKDISGALLNNLVNWTIQYCPNVESIDLSGNDELSLISLQNPSHLDRLSRLCLNVGASNFNLEDWDLFFRIAGKNLTVLNLFNSYNLTNEHIVSIVRHCPQLISLNVGKCFNLTSAILLDLQTYAKSIVEFYADELYIEIEDIQKSSLFLSRIDQLSLSGCSNSSLILEKLSQYNLKIKKINLSRCRDLDSETLQNFTRDNPQLMFLDIREIPFTSFFLDSLERTDSQLQIFHEDLTSRFS